MDPNINNILIRAHIDPKTVLQVNPIPNYICPWCNYSCGHLAILLPCNHRVCFSCLDNIVDSKQEQCPHCFINITSFTVTS